MPQAITAMRAEVLSADAYAAFEESEDVRATGAHFWNEILAQGGSRSAMESFKRN